MSNHTQRISSALHFIDPSQRDTWVQMGMAVKSELGDTGFDLWENWSRNAESFNDHDARDVWKSIRAEGKVTVGTLFHEAKANGWCDDDLYQRPSAEELAERQRIAAERAVKEDAEIARERADTAQNALAILKAATNAPPEHPYLVRKQVLPVATLREIDAGNAATILGYSPRSGGEVLTGCLLVVPVKQGDGLSTLELIDGEGRKTALAGRGSKAGGYWATERLPEGDGTGFILLIGEGVATVLSARQASGHPAIAALSSGNLLAVATVLRSRYPAATLVILADLVKATGRADPHAIEAATAVGGKLAVPDFGSNRPQDATDFNDLMILSGVEAVQRGIENATLPASIEARTVESALSVDNSADIPWTAPQPLTAKIEPEPYPIDALPEPIRAAVEEVAGFVKAPLPMVASSALAALSLAIQAHVNVSRAARLQGPVGLFLLTIADSGERKSTCDGFFTKPIRDFEAAQAELAKPILSDYRADVEAWEAKRAGIKEKIRQLAKNGTSTHDEEAALRDLEHEAPEPPRIPRLLYTDATPEALAYALAKHWPAAGVVSAEAGLVLGSHGMGSESVMRNLAMLNQLWDGDGLTIDRRSTESFTVRGARLTVALQIQEPTLRSFLDKTGALARGTGFLARFLVAWPESTQGSRSFTDPPENWPHLATFHRRIAAILEKEPAMDEDGALTPALLSLVPDAKAAWVAYHDAIENELASGGELYDIRDVASKSPDNAARLAALFHVFEHGYDGPIGRNSVESGSRIAAWHLLEARRFFGEMALPVELASAARLDSWLIAHARAHQTLAVGKNHVRQYGPLREGGRLEAAIRELVDLDRLRLDKEGKRLILRINPALLREVL